MVKWIQSWPKARAQICSFHSMHVKYSSQVFRSLNLQGDQEILGHPVVSQLQNLLNLFPKGKPAFSRSLLRSTQKWGHLAPSHKHNEVKRISSQTVNFWVHQILIRVSISIIRSFYDKPYCQSCHKSLQSSRQLPPTVNLLIWKRQQKQLLDPSRIK